MMFGARVAALFGLLATASAAVDYQSRSSNLSTTLGSSKCEPITLWKTATATVTIQPDPEKYGQQPCGKGCGTTVTTTCTVTVTQPHEVTTTKK
jgi:hypothetical protein